MIVVLFLLLLLLFPIKIHAKIRLDLKRQYFCLGLFAYRLHLLDFDIFEYCERFYYTITRLKQKPLINDDKKVKKAPIKYDFLKGEQLDVLVRGSLFTHDVNALIASSLSIISPLICQIIDERLNIAFQPDFFEQNIKVYSNLSAFTTLGLIILQFFKKLIKGAKNVSLKSN